MASKGVGRFEVVGLDSDRELIRSLARRLATNDPGTVLIRSTVAHAVALPKVEKGSILDALRRSPLVEARLDFKRVRGAGRKIAL